MGKKRGEYQCMCVSLTRSLWVSLCVTVQGLPLVTSWGAGSGEDVKQELSLRPASHLSLAGFIQP